MDHVETTGTPRRAGVILSIQGRSPLGSSTAHKSYPAPESGWATSIEAAACEVFELMLGVRLSHVSETLPAQGEITAMVGLAGGLTGVLSVRCTLAVAAFMASKMLGMDVNAEDAATRDAVGEICNMIAGTFKTTVSGLEETCFLSTPTIVTGHDFKIYSPGGSQTVEVPLKLASALMWVTLDIHQ